MIVTGRDFRANQSRYIGNNLAAELRNALSDVKDALQGKKKLLSWEELLDELDEMEGLKR